MVRRAAREAGTSGKTARATRVLYADVRPWNARLWYASSVRAAANRVGTADARRVVARRPGSWGVLAIEHFTPAMPARGEVRIAVRAAGVNYADAIARMGLYEPAWRYAGWPLTPGFEVAGEIDALGDGVADLEVGDRVLAVTRFGGYASHLVAPRERVFRLPARLSFEEAAGVPAVFLTAWWALFELAHVRAGQRILVHSAAGGVGGALLQLARDVGVDAVGVVGCTEKIETARALGATHVLVRGEKDMWTRARALAPNGYDVVLDATGPETLRKSYEHLGSPGKLVVYGFHSMLSKTSGRPSPLRLVLGWLKTPRFDPLRMTAENKSVLAFNLAHLVEATSELHRAMDELLARIEAGRITALPTRAYPLECAGEAHRAIESGETVGKLVLVP